MNLEQMKDLILDKLLPVRGPFIKCPSCGRDSFGVERIEHLLLKRRCVKCGYPPQGKAKYESLPRLNKKILYLDQFALSNMMKSIHPNWTSKHSEPDFQLWKACYAELSRLVQMQLVACPVSEFHVRESLAWPEMYNNLKLMVEMLSNGVEFLHPNDVETSQVIDSFLLWRGIKSERDVSRRIAMRGNLDGWKEATFSLRIPISRVLYEEAISAKYESAEDFEDIHSRWKTESDGDYGHWLKEEKQSYGNALILSLSAVAKKLLSINKDIRSGLAGNQHFLEQQFTHMEMNWVRHPLQVIQQLLIGRGHNFCDTAEIMQQFLSSREIEETPNNMISAALWGAKAHEAKAGKKEMGVGFSVDHNAIATFLPFCDAMIIDAECKRLLEFTQKRGDIAYNTRLFCARDRQELVTYLQGIRESATWEHKNDLKRAFGSDDLQPDFSLYEHDN